MSQESKKVILVTGASSGMGKEMAMRLIGEGPYAPMARAMAAGARQSYEKGDGSPASVIADVISRAIAARKPRTRYVAGKYARPLMFMRRWFGERFFDRLMLGQVKRYQKGSPS